MKQAFLDLDGTLLNSKQRHGMALNRILLSKGYPQIEPMEFVNYKASGKATIDYLQSELCFSGDVAKELSRLWIELIEEDELLAYDTWYEDSVVFLKKLRKIGCEINLLTARKNEKGLTSFLNDSDYSDFFDNVYVVAPNKSLVEKAGVLIEHCNNDSFIVGDSEVDYYAALEAQIPCYLLNRGFRNEFFWTKRGVKSYKGLFDIFEKVVCCDIDLVDLSIQC